MAVPEMNEVAKPFGGRRRSVRLVGWHEERPLAQERLRIRRHLGQVEEDHEHLDDRSLRVEQRHLNGTSPGHMVTKYRSSLAIILIGILTRCTLYRPD